MNVNVKDLRCTSLVMHIHGDAPRDAVPSMHTHWEDGVTLRPVAATKQSSGAAGGCRARHLHVHAAAVEVEAIRYISCTLWLCIHVHLRPATLSCKAGCGLCMA